MDANNILIFNLYIEFFFIELVNDSSGLALKWYLHTLGYTLKTFKLAILGLQSTQPKLKDNKLHLKYAFAP